MTWFILALIPPILYAATNHIDKYLISKFFEDNRGLGSLILYSSLFGIVVSFFIYLFNNEVFNVPGIDIFLLIIIGILGVMWIILYLYALDLDETSIVTPLFLVIPVFGFILEYFILNQIMTPLQIIGSATIIVGGIFLNIEMDLEENGKIKFNKKVFLLMMSSSLLVALVGVLFKFVTVEENFWTYSFWEYIGFGVAGIALFLFIKSYRVEFIRTLKESGSKIFSLNIFNEAITIVGNLAKNFAILLVPVTLVYSVEALQPLFVVLIGIFLTIFFPNIAEENIRKSALIKKFSAIFVMIIGTILITI